MQGAGSQGVDEATSDKRFLRKSRSTVFWFWKSAVQWSRMMMLECDMKLEGLGGLNGQSPIADGQRKSDWCDPRSPRHRQLLRHAGARWWAGTPGARPGRRFDASRTKSRQVAPSRTKSDQKRGKICVCKPGKREPNEMQSLECRSAVAQKLPPSPRLRRTRWRTGCRIQMGRLCTGCIALCRIISLPEVNRQEMDGVGHGKVKIDRGLSQQDFLENRRFCWRGILCLVGNSYG